MARRGSDDSKGAMIDLTKAQLALMKKVQPDLEQFQQRFNYLSSDDRTVALPVRRISVPALKRLQEDYKEAGSKMGDRWAMGQIAAHIDARESQGGKPVKELRALETAIIEWAKAGIIRGWVFERAKDEEGSAMQALQLNSCRYYPKEYLHGGGVRPAYVKIELKHWEKDQMAESSRTWRAPDLNGLTVKQLMAQARLFHETPDLIKIYDEQEKQFLEWRAQLGEQFVANGPMQVFETDEDGKIDNYKPRDEKMVQHKIVVDDDNEQIQAFESSALFIGADDGEERVEDEVAAEKYSRIPFAPFIWCFDLNAYEQGWVHTAAMRPYVYRPELRDKLILPEEHRELIDVLTSEVGLLVEDIVEGKSGGTAILCQGPAGTGKTLTAEVYAEVMKRPLYRVHSGQLGTDSQSVEQALKLALENATRWRAVLLIDECDVFISQRGDNLEKNAVIGVFLRVMEYYSGIIFLTTNRLDAIDEAILSRTIAVIHYKLPEEAERRNLWITLSDVFEVPMAGKPENARKLANLFPKASGRDMKGLLKLVRKYAHRHGREARLEDFKKLSVFKGVDLAHA